MIGLLAIAVLVLLLPPVIHDLVRRPTIRRLGIRNVTRRRGEAALVVGGSMLATALIVASLVIGSSFDTSIRGIAATSYGPTDEVVLLDTPGEAAELTAAIARQPGATEVVDGTVATVLADVAVASIRDESRDDRRVEPDAQLLEADLASLVSFGADPGATGLGSIDPASVGRDDVVVNQRLADAIDVGVGEPVELFVGGVPTTFTVAAIAPASGLAGFADVVVVEGRFADVVASAGLDLDETSTTALFVSNAGDVFSGADLTDEATSVIEAAAAETGVEVEVLDVKRDLLVEAEQEGAEMTELFGTIGGFSVVAGILLVINLFVMLAGERTVELGTMRALGLRRGHVLRAFAIEGAVYGLLAAAIGALLGIGVAAGVMAFASTLFEGESGFEIALDVQLVDLVVGGVIGLAISQLTVVLTSWRTTRINIVRALKDLPAQARHGSGVRRLLVGVAGVGLGAAMYVLGSTSPLLVMLGPVVVAVAAIPLLGLVVPRRAATVVGCGVGLAWPVVVFGVESEVMDEPEVGVFLLQGVLLVGLATALFASLDRVWLGLAERLSGGGIASRLGLAHPLARPVRSALLVAMYALVLFTVTFMAVINSVFQASAPELAAHGGGTYELVVDSNRSGPIEAEALTARPDVDHVSAVRRGFAEVDGSGWTVSAIDASWRADLAPLAPTFDPAFSSHEAVWEAVQAGTRAADGSVWIIVPDYFDGTVGDRIELEGSDGSTVDAAIGGLTRNNWLVSAGLYVPAVVAPELFGVDGEPTRYFVDLSDAADVELAASEITASAPERGVDARSFLAVAKVELDEQEGFLQMLQGYLGLGLLIGIAGLGVVLVRAVRERRRELGMLAAVGVPQGQTQRAFLFEAGFIGAQGVVLGIGLGVLSSWQVLTRTTAFEEDLQFAVPYGWLVGLAVLALGASLLAAAGPAHRAGRVPPAVALRVTG